VVSLALPLSALAEDKDQQQKIDSLTKEVEALKQREKKLEEKSLSKWLTIGGDYRFRFDSLKGDVPNYYQYMGPTAMPVAVPGYSPKNDTLMTNRFGLNIKAKATQDVTLTSRLLMYKTFGMETAQATNAGFFADRVSILDGTIGHVPLDNTLRVDQVYATWSNIGGQPLWFSVGRRPSTGGSPTHLRQDNDRPGNGGVPGLLVDYAFDGMTIGYAPEIDFLPGAYGKVCYGRGFEAGYSSKNSLSDTDMLGFQLIPVDTDPIRIDFQYNRGFNIFDNPNNVGKQLGDIDWFGVGLLSTLKQIGPGTLNSFASGGLSITRPNGNHALLDGAGSPDSGAGLLVNGPDTSSHTGWSVYAGLRYDLPTGTKIGAEYNHGSEFWMPFDPAADDMWTSKLGTRGNVYEAYLIQELPLQPISSYNAKTFIRLGYQYYDFTYTGSNNWVGAPVKVSDLAASPMNAQMFAPLKSAHDIYATFEVKL
jgi:opacity protein-like surface antigen